MSRTIFKVVLISSRPKKQGCFVSCYSVFVVAKLMRKVIILTIQTIGRQDRIGLNIAKLDAY